MSVGLKLAYSTVPVPYKIKKKNLNYFMDLCYNMDVKLTLPTKVLIINYTYIVYIIVIEIRLL